VAVAGGRERIGARRAFCPSLATVAHEQRLAGAKYRSPASRRADCCSAMSSWVIPVLAPSNTAISAGFFDLG
jgi:hypothetical protein